MYICDRSIEIYDRYDLSFHAGVVSTEPRWLGDLPYYDIPRNGSGIYNLEPHVVGDMPQRPTTQFSSTMTSSTDKVTSSTTTFVEAKSQTTFQDRSHPTPGALTDNQTTPVVQWTTAALTETEQSTSPTNETATTKSPWPLDFFGLKWYWYVSIGIGAFSIILVIIIVILISRLKRKTYYAPNPRPRVVLRSISSFGDGDAISVVTPTRGFCQLTLDSQSSLPKPYTAFSPVNTSTFGRKDAQGMKFVYYDRTRSSTTSDGARPSDGGWGGGEASHSYDRELSDDCFL
jgi:hypothetical protein